MAWFANPQRRRAYRVVKFIERRAVFVLQNQFGATFEEPLQRLLDNGYHRVKTKPRYAPQ